jgi:hypothetical protein
MSDSFSKANCSFHTSDNEDGTFWICADPQGATLKLGGRAVDVGLDLKPGTSMKEADDLAATLREFVAQVRLWQD